MILFFILYNTTNITTNFALSKSSTIYSTEASEIPSTSEISSTSETPSTSETLSIFLIIQIDFKYKPIFKIVFLFISVNSSSTILSETSSHDLFNHCVGNVDWIGDGICDSDLLTKQCFYDGGDCCDGIVKEYCIDSGTYVQCT